MSAGRKILKWGAGAVIAAFVSVSVYLWLAPPELLRLGSSYSSKLVCSNVQLAGRNINEVMASDGQELGDFLVHLFKAEEVAPGQVRTRFLGFFAPQDAVYRPGIGCAVVPDGDIQSALSVKLRETPSATPAVPLARFLIKDIQAVISDPQLHGPGMRAVVVVKDGKIITETYGTGFGPETRLIGWSMTKTVTAAIVSLREAEGKLRFDADHLRPEWNNDDRAKIKISDLLAMQSGLVFNEDYGGVSDVSRMLFLEPDQAKYAASQPLEAAPGEKFRYSTGTSVLLSRLWMDTFEDQQEALAYPHKALFDRIGMHSAVMETDSRGTFSGGSFLYATAQDWARFGLLLVNGGVWDGKRILSETFMKMVSTPTPVSDGKYTGGNAWKRGPGSELNDKFGLPKDTYWLLGHQGQSIAVIPSERLVVVRMGLTPTPLQYRVQPMVAKIVAASN